MIGTSKKYTKKIPKGKYWEASKFPSVIDTFHPFRQKAWNHYMMNTGKRDKIAKTRTTYAHAMHAIYKAIGELLFEYEGGVEVQEYGYFAISIIPWKNKGSDHKFNKDPYFHTKGYAYTLQLYSDIFRNSCIKGMIMDRTFDYRLKHKVYEKLYDGFRPKLYYTLMKSMNKRKNAK